MNDEVFVPRDFVCLGYRLTSGKKKGVMISPVDDDGMLTQSLLFKVVKGKTLTCGYRYTGAQFSETQVRGLVTASLVSQWPDETERLRWLSDSKATETTLRRAKIEAEAGRVDDFEQILKPLRIAREKLYRRFDSEGLRAFDDAVMAALRTPPRASEKS